MRARDFSNFELPPSTLPWSTRLTDSNVSGIFGNSKNRDVAIKALTLHGIFFQLVKSDQDACDTATGISPGSSTSQAGESDKIEFNHQCVVSLGEMFYLENQSDPAEDDLTRFILVVDKWYLPPITGRSVSAGEVASNAIKKATPGLEESVQRVAAQATSPR